MFFAVKLKTMNTLNIMNRSFLLILACASGFLLTPSCSKSSKTVSETTGWSYNDPKWGGYEKVDYKGQDTGPNLVLVEGGTFTMGLSQEDVMYEWNAVPRRVTVTSFYMDETEVSNREYRFYTEWLGRTFGGTYPEIIIDALPDTLVWLDELSYNEPMAEQYFRYPSYDDYPVVGVSHVQATDFCKWRTDRVNETRLIRQGVLNPNLEQKDQDNFNTGSYLVGQYEGNVRKNVKDLSTGESRPVRIEDGILLPGYRLPTEAEWEYAAYALKGNLIPGDENISAGRTYSWSGNTVRYEKRDKYQGAILANFKKGSGDYMGIAGKLNDNAAGPGPVRAYLPNDFGLYNMSGNVGEWVMDVYRPMTSSALRDEDNHDLNPFRGSKFTKMVKDEDGRPVEKDSMGRLRYEFYTKEELANRTNVRTNDATNYRDGDDFSEVTYETDVHTLISNKSRVYKGGSWADRAYWLSPGTRRFMDEDQTSRAIGFRCAMNRLGGATGNNTPDGNTFQVKSKRPVRK